MPMRQPLHASLVVTRRHTTEETFLSLKKKIPLVRGHLEVSIIRGKGGPYVYC